MITTSIEIKKDQVNEDILKKYKNKEIKELKNEILKQSIKPDLFNLEKEVLLRKLNEFKNKTWDQLKNDNTWTLTIQSTLKALGYYENGKIDALYGKKTIDAIKKFQKDIGFTGVDLDGLAGTKTITKLIEKFIEKLQKTLFEKIINNINNPIWKQEWMKQKAAPEKKDTNGNTIKTVISLDNIPGKEKGYKWDEKEVYIFRKDGKMYKFFGNGRAGVYNPEKKLFDTMKNSTDRVNELIGKQKNEKTPAPKVEKTKIPVTKPDTTKIDSTKVVIPTPVDSTKVDAPVDSTKINSPIDSTTVNIPTVIPVNPDSIIGPMPYDSTKINQPIDLTKITEETKETEKTDNEILKGQFEFSGFSADTIAITGDKALITDTKQNLEIEFDYKNRIFSNPKLKAGDEKYNLHLSGKNNNTINIVPDSLKMITAIKDYIKNPVIIDGLEKPEINKWLEFSQSPSSIVFCGEDLSKSTFQVRFSNLGELQQVETGYNNKVYTVKVTEKNGKKQIELTSKIEIKPEETKTTIDSTTVIPAKIEETKVEISPELKQKLDEVNKKIESLQTDIEAADMDATKDPQEFLDRYNAIKAELDAIQRTGNEKTEIINKLKAIYDESQNENGEMFIPGTLGDYRRKYLRFKKIEAENKKKKEEQIAKKE